MKISNPFGSSAARQAGAVEPRPGDAPPRARGALRSLGERLSLRRRDPSIASNRPANPEAGARDRLGDLSMPGATRTDAASPDHFAEPSIEWHLRPGAKPPPRGFRLDVLGSIKEENEEGDSKETAHAAIWSKRKPTSEAGTRSHPSDFSTLAEQPEGSDIESNDERKPFSRPQGGPALTRQSASSRRMFDEIVPRLDPAQASDGVSAEAAGAALLQSSASAAPRATHGQTRAPSNPRTASSAARGKEAVEHLPGWPLMNPRMASVLYASATSSAQAEQAARPARMPEDLWPAVETASEGPLWKGRKPRQATRMPSDLWPSFEPVEAAKATPSTAASAEPTYERQTPRSKS